MLWHWFLCNIKMRLFVQHWPLHMSRPRMLSEFPPSNKISFPWGTWWAVIGYRRRDEESLIFVNLETWFASLYVCLVGFLPDYLCFKFVLKANDPDWQLFCLADTLNHGPKSKYQILKLGCYSLILTELTNHTNSNCKNKSSNCSRNTWSFFSARMIQINNHKPFIQDDVLTWALIASFIMPISKPSTPGQWLSPLYWHFITIWTDKISDPPLFSVTLRRKHWDSCIAWDPASPSALKVFILKDIHSFGKMNLGSGS